MSFSVELKFKMRDATVLLLTIIQLFGIGYIIEVTDTDTEKDTEMRRL